MTCCINRKVMSKHKGIYFMFTTTIYCSAVITAACPSITSLKLFMRIFVSLSKMYLRNKILKYMKYIKDINIEKSYKINK